MIQRLDNYEEDVLLAESLEEGLSRCASQAEGVTARLEVIEDDGE